MQKSSNLFILNVQYCKSCHTHNWCTHHDQQKYHNTYKKLKQHLQKQFGSDIFIQGNVIPEELVPIKPAENKYFNSKTNKYVTFPSIGAFEVMLQSELIFSKKSTNTWPNFGEVADLIYERLHGKQRQRSRSPQQRKHNTMKNVNQKMQLLLNNDVDIKTQKDHVSLKNESFLDHSDKRSTFYKFRPQNHKNFTLTDHFKNYHNANYKTPFNNDSTKHASEQYFTTTNTDNEHQSSEISSFRNVNSSEKDFLQFKRNFDMFGLESNSNSSNRLPEFFKKKGYMKDDSGKKQMIIRLDSIEEESILVDENNNLNYGQNVNLTNTHSTFRSKPKDAHKKLMKRFTDDFEELQAKFKNFQQKVQNIREENKKFDQKDPTNNNNKLNEKILREINEIKKKQKHLRNSQIKQQKINDEVDQDEMMQNPIIFARRKLKNIEDYINGTEEEKNQKLKKIYGEWKLLKKPYKGRNYVSPYKIEVSKRTDKSKNKHQHEKNQSQFSESMSSSDQEVSQHKTRAKIRPPKLPKMPGLRHSKSNQVLTQEKFYSTARDQFQKLGNRKLKSKMSQKKFQSFQSNSAQKKIHHNHKSSGLKLNTFDHILSSQVSKEKKRQQNENELENYQFFGDQKQQITNNRNKLQKQTGAKSRTKQNFSTAANKASSRGRKMSRSSRKIDQNERDDEFLMTHGKQQNDRNSVSGEIDSRQQVSHKKNKNFRSKKNQNFSNSKSREKQYSENSKTKEQLRFKKSKQENPSQEQADSSNESLDSERQMQQKSHHNSKSLQNNFFDEVSKTVLNRKKSSSRVKKNYEKSIGDLKEWKSVEGNRKLTKLKQSNQKQREKITSKGKQVRKQAGLRKSSYEEDEQEFGRETKQELTKKTSEQQNALSQNVIRTTQHKLTKKSKAQRQKQEQLNRKNSQKVIEDSESKLTSSGEQDESMVNETSQKNQGKEQQVGKAKTSQSKNYTKKNQAGLKPSKKTLNVDQKVEKTKNKQKKSKIMNNSDEEDLQINNQHFQTNPNESNEEQQFSTGQKASQGEKRKLHKKQKQSQQSVEQSESSNESHSQNIEHTEQISDEQKVDGKPTLKTKKETMKKLTNSTGKNKPQKAIKSKGSKQQSKNQEQNNQMQNKSINGENDQQCEQDSASGIDHLDQNTEQQQSSSSEIEKPVQQLNNNPKNNTNIGHSQSKKKAKINVNVQSKKVEGQKKKKEKQLSIENDKTQEENNFNRESNQSQESIGEPDSQKLVIQNEPSIVKEKKSVKKESSKRDKKDLQQQLTQNEKNQAQKKSKKSNALSSNDAQEEQQKGDQSQSKGEQSISQSQSEHQSLEESHIPTDQNAPTQGTKIQKSSKIKGKYEQQQSSKQKYKNSKKSKNNADVSENDIKDSQKVDEQADEQLIEREENSQTQHQDQGNNSASKEQKPTSKNKSKSKKPKATVLDEQSRQQVKKSKQRKNKQLSQNSSNANDENEQRYENSTHRNSNNQGDDGQELSSQCNQLSQNFGSQKNDEKKIKKAISQQDQQNLKAEADQSRNIQKHKQNPKSSSKTKENKKKKKQPTSNKESSQTFSVPNSMIKDSEKIENPTDKVHADDGSSEELEFDEKTSQNRQQNSKPEQNEDKIIPSSTSHNQNAVDGKNTKNQQSKAESDQRTSQKRSINTSRTNRNKILNVYDTDRLDGEDDEELSNDNHGQKKDECKNENTLKIRNQNLTMEGQTNQEQTQQQTEKQRVEISSKGVTENKSQAIQQQKQQNTHQSLSKDVKDVGIQINNVSFQKSRTLDQSVGLDSESKCVEAENQKTIQNRYEKNVSNPIRQISPASERKDKDIQNPNPTVNGIESKLKQTSLKDNKVEESQPQLELSRNLKENQKPVHDSITERKNLLSPQQINPAVQQDTKKQKLIKAPITKQFYGPSFQKQLQIFPTYFSHQKSSPNRTQIPNNEPTIPFPNNQNLPPNSILTSLPNHYLTNKNITLFNQKSLSLQKIKANHPITNLIKCLKILTQINDFLIIRLFENPFIKLSCQKLSQSIFGVWLCINYKWTCVIVDLKAVLVENGTDKLYFLNHEGNQLWPIVLVQALAKGLGSYNTILQLPCHKLFNILTGSNSLFFNIKQDPTKNGRILRYVNDCENKNFVLHAEKVCRNLEELENKDREVRVFYVLSQRTVNENDVLLEIRDSSKEQAQWIKLAKFVQEFKSIEILQLRINHNFSSVPLPKPTSTQNLTILSLQFIKQSFGSITLSTQPHITPLLKTFLYREQKSNYLKLVGQAQQKNKSSLFFDCCFGEGKYWLFVECGCEGRVTYLGENQPRVEIVEEVRGDGLKNDWTEYLPVKVGGNRLNKENVVGLGSTFRGEGLRMPNKLSKNNFSETGMTFMSRDDRIQKLRENFVQYLLKGRQSN